MGQGNKEGCSYKADYCLLHDEFVLPRIIDTVSSDCQFCINVLLYVVSCELKD